MNLAQQAFETSIQSISAREQLLLAPFAMHSDQSAGRKYDEPPHPYRGTFQRDRDRILHSAAFRRLSGKMQVFTGDMGDYHRTRLTHTMEVSSIARTIGRAWRLNEDLIEALALLHDIGHPPFGHAGEEVLNDCLADSGGFSHNEFALTLVEHLEQRYAEFPGLNLSREVLSSQAARSKKEELPPLLEAQVVDIADSIAYNAHDVDDAIKLKLVQLKELQPVPLVGPSISRCRDNHPTNLSMTRKLIVHELIDQQVTDILTVCGPKIVASGWQSPHQARQSGFMVATSDELADRKKQLEQFLHNRVYRNERLMDARRRSQVKLLEMFDGIVSKPELLTERFASRACEVGLKRAVVEYLASMTDRFCAQTYERLFGDSAG